MDNILAQVCRVRDLVTDRYTLQLVFYTSFQLIITNNPFQDHYVTCGVRQGGVLSPFRFNIFVDNLISWLEYSNLGLLTFGVCYQCKT